MLVFYHVNTCPEYSRLSNTSGSRLEDDDPTTQPKAMTTPDEDWRDDDTAALFRAVLTLETVEEAASFFRDLCTRRELTDLSHRWAVARLLAQGLPYREISEMTGASTATITRINQWLRHGAGGYRMALERMEGVG
jgi:TrpR-related protein YerC/YecD